ncbi:galactoside 3(4)-L-fucosyltransferase-like isoform X2 [Cephus cinctus]|uniref:Fucosyltransferase n=1 Tax=Cephus cinctus TaxID=211228 RepID=A0AAJ7R738_CEPCN|nr:galactoside 3(4)-L-fucosyltransferase-like isoform X2 [Cephus cinctus]
MVNVSMGLKLLLLLSVISVLLYILFIEYFTIYDTAVNKLKYSIQLNHKGNSSNELSKHLNKIEKKKYTNEEIENMSNLGKLLFLAANGTYPPASQRSNKYLILVWQYGSYLERRHLRRYSPWLDCSVECQLSYNSRDLKKADAVLFHLHRMKNRQQMPRRMHLLQRWVFLTDESPLHTFLYGNQELTDYNGLFNWSMSYRSDSDVPVPYGRTIDRQVDVDLTEFYDMFKKKNNLVAIMGSNCGGSNGRWNYVKHLKNLLGDHLDIYGHCLQGNINACPGHFDNDCTVLESYKFYLAFENSNCKEYLTEKTFWHGYHKWAVPIIMGAAQSECEKLLPPKSYLHVEDFASPAVLATYLLYLHRHDDEYFTFHQWRRHYKVINEHGYFGSASKHYCRLCEALHYNSPKAKTYQNLEQFWSKEKDCTLVAWNR